MHWLMKLPEMFAALGTALAAAFMFLIIGKKYLLAGFCCLLACVGWLAGCAIGKGYDLFSEAGLRRVRWLGGISALMLVGVVLTCITA